MCPIQEANGIVWPLPCMEYISDLYANRDGSISWPQFWSAVQDAVKLQDLFSVADEDKDGKLSNEEFTRALSTQEEGPGAGIFRDRTSGSIGPQARFRSFCKKVRACIYILSELL